MATWLSVQAETADLGRAHSRPLPPTPPAFYAIGVLAPAARPAHPAHITFRNVQEGEPHGAASQGTRNGKPHPLLPRIQDSPFNSSLATVPPQRAQPAPRLTRWGAESCLSSRVSDLLPRFLESLLPSPPPGRGTDNVEIRFLLKSKTGKFHVQVKGE